MNCTKCNGKGRLEGFRHIDNGVCFRCAGTGEFISRERAATIRAEQARKSDERHDARVARSCGLTLDEFHRALRGA